MISLQKKDTALDSIKDISFSELGINYFKKKVFEVNFGE